MSESMSEAVKVLAYAGLIFGLFGTVAPVIPGPAVVWLSALLWAWADGFDKVGWPTLLLMLVLAALATAADVLLTLYGGRRSGAAWSSMVVASAVAAGGLLAFGFPGAIAGVVVGLVSAEWWRNGRDWRLAWRSSGGALAGWIASFFVQFALVLLMVLVFTLQAFAPS